ncbi:MAG: hypothetical protein IIB00_10985, partial [candidate division Zixibacteria bacterium]|nr:hypothetical protein [candidate division Zixibacteria bacterium]
MSKRILFYLSVCVLVGGAAIVATADVPPRINYQGFLTGTGNNPVNGNRDFMFSIYDQET